MAIAPSRRAGLRVAIAIAALTVVPVAHGSGADPQAARVTATARVDLQLDLTTGFPAAAKFRPGMRTSDLFAAEWWCAADPIYEGFCEVRDRHDFTPKNIGNILCLPKGEDDYVVEESCAALLDAGISDDCQVNSNSGAKACIDAPIVKPYCNYRTRDSGEVTWSWTVSEADDHLVIGCSQVGYAGFTSQDLAEDATGSIATGCLARGRLRALSLGDEPLRPCRRGEVRVTIPAVESD